MPKTKEDKRYVGRSEVQSCCICGRAIHGYGHNPTPVATGRCCDECNTYVVIPVRISMLFSNAKKKEG